MNDQAEKLRQLMNGLKEENRREKSTISKDIISKDPISDNETTRVITITSGKGGVGKSNFTINLGLALIKLGYSVTILDADLGLANIDVIVGVIPKYTLAHVIRKEKTLEEAIVKGPEGINLISGGSGITELANLTEEQIGILIDSLKTLGKSVDFILIDTGAGINNSVISFVDAANEVILISTPEPTSITDAYAMLKTMVVKDKEKSIRLLINRVESNKEGDLIFSKLNTVAQKFLNIKIQKLGYLYDDISVSRSVKAQKPVLLNNPNSIVSKGIEAIASRLVDESNGNTFKVSGFKKFINKLFNKYKEPL